MTENRKEPDWGFPSEMEIAECLEPAISRKFKPTDLVWQATLMRIRRRILRSLALRPLRRILIRLPAALDYKYEKIWSADAALRFVSLSRNQSTPVAWLDHGYLASSWGMRRVHLLVLARIIKHFRPRNVLEVGSGAGTNLLVLAALFPDIEFTGVELSRAGVEASRQLSSSPEVRPELIELSPLPIVSGTRSPAISFVQASADNTPFTTGQFDLVFSVQALEQMELIRDSVLSEIARLTAEHAVFLEPFRDWNQSPFKRMRILGSGYWQGRISDLRDHGLEPTFETDAMPAKPFFTIGLAVTRKVRKRAELPPGVVL